MAIYRSQNNRSLATITPEERLSNQVVLTGTNEKLLSDKGIFFLELLECSGTVEIKDGKGRTIASAATSFSQDHSPIRCDFGIEFVGTVAVAKGFILESVLA